MKKEFATFSGTVPALYDQYMGPLFFEPYALDIAGRLKKIQPNNVLEIACGTGRVTKHIRHALDDAGKLMATDLNPGMIDIARDVLRGMDIEFRVADAQALPFNDESFDCVVCQFGFMFVPDKVKAFAEVSRVLKKDGRIIFNTWDKIENNPLSETVRNVVANYFAADKVGDFYKIPFSMNDQEEFQHLLEQAHFHDICITRVTKEGIAPSCVDGAKGLILGTPAFMEISAVDGSAPAKLVTLAEKEIARLYGDNPCKSELNAWVCEARK